MRSTVDAVEIVCPKCGEEFADWQSTSLPSNDSLPCPRCGHDLASDPLFHEDGIWVLETPPEEVVHR